MMRDIYLHGACGRRFGRRFKLDVASPGEAIRALCTLRPGLREMMRAGYWRLVVGPAHVGNAIDLAYLHMNMGGQALHLVPAMPPRGGDVGNVGKIVAGTVLMVASFFMPYLAPMTFMLGLSLAMGGISGLLTPTPQAQPGQQATDLAPRPEDRPSFFFQGVTNNSQQGGPVPLVFGTHLTGSIVVGGSINTQDIA
jgi:predicted phage tail protein